MINNTLHGHWTIISLILISHFTDKQFTDFHLSHLDFQKIGPSKRMDVKIFTKLTTIVINVINVIYVGKRDLLSKTPHVS